MRRKGVRIWGIFLFLLAVTLAGCLPTLGETVMPEPPTAPPPPTALPVVVVVPPPIPHTVEEARQDCLLCHAVGAAEAPPVPADADHKQAESCRACHALLSQPAVPVVAPPTISHDLVGREDCLMCHKMGIAYAPRIPDNHVGLPVDLCQTCHRAVAPAAPLLAETRVTGVMPLQIPHPLEGRTDCRLCHETGAGGAPKFPPDHADRANEVCLVCHAAASQIVATPVLSPTEMLTPTSALPTAAPTEAVPVAGDVTKGASLYATHCAMCHGDKGQGTAIAKEPVNSAEFLAGSSDDDLRQAIADGVPGTAMPSYTSKLSTEDTTNIVAFLRSWQQ